MTLLGDAVSGLGRALLPVVAALLFEELTYGGLVRLLIAPWPLARKHGVPRGGLSPRRGRDEHNHPTNQRPICGDPGRLQAGNLGGGK
jgi:hypothetical protein